MRTQVGIVGAGPAGLVLALLLRRAGIDSVVIEDRSRAHIEQRIRAGLLEQWVTDLLVELGVGERMRREGMFHRGIFLNFAGELHHIDFRNLIAKGVTIYGQQEVVKDLVERLLADGVAILFEVENVTIHDFAGGSPTIRFRHDGADKAIDCDFIGGCDGSHGICRPSFPSGLLQVFEREYPLSASGRSWRPVSMACGRSAAATSCRRASRRCAASWSSRCRSGTCFLPATPPISSRRRAPRA
jgi:p-hydroxybenzoate 3-monooxygenase